MDDTQWWTRKSASYNLVHWVQWVNIIFVYLIFYFGPNLFCSGLKIFGLDQKNSDLIKIFWTWTTPNDELEKVRHNLVLTYTRVDILYLVVQIYFGQVQKCSD